MRILFILLIAALPAAHAAEPAAGEASSAAGASAPAPAVSALPAAAQSAPAAVPATAVPPPALPETAIPAATAQPAAPASAPGAAAPKKASRRPPRARRLARKHAPASTSRETAADAEQGRNPVIEAITLVASTQAAEIMAADHKVANADWWLDTLDREWIVKRPFGPGLFDSTHWFYVSYKVNGRVLMSWFVDLAKGTVSPTTPPDRLDVQK